MHRPSGSRVRTEARIGWLVCSNGDFVFAAKMGESCNCDRIVGENYTIVLIA